MSVVARVITPHLSSSGLACCRLVVMSVPYDAVAPGFILASLCVCIMMPDAETDSRSVMHLGDFVLRDFVVDVKH